MGESRELLKECLRRFRAYEMDVDCEPPEHHRAFCLRLERHLELDANTIRTRGTQPDLPANIPEYVCPRCGKTYKTRAMWERVKDRGCECGWWER